MDPGRMTPFRAPQVGDGVERIYPQSRSAPCQGAIHAIGKAVQAIDTIESRAGIVS
jgi:hypothetical protein